MSVVLWIIIIPGDIYQKIVITVSVFLLKGCWTLQELQALVFALNLINSFILSNSLITTGTWLYYFLKEEDWMNTKDPPSTNLLRFLSTIWTNLFLVMWWVEGYGKSLMLHPLQSWVSVPDSSCCAGSVLWLATYSRSDIVPPSISWGYIYL